MILTKKLSIILLGLSLIGLTGCQSNTTSSPHKNNSSHINHQKEDSNLNKDATDQSSSDQPASNQSSDDTNGSDQNNTGTTGTNDTSTSDAKSNDSNQGQKNTTEKQKIGEYITSVRIADTQTGWVGGEGWIAKTTDGGKHWNAQYFGEQTVHQLFALNHHDVWVTFKNTSNTSEGLRLLHSNDGGEHWSPVSKVPNKGFFHFITEKIGFSGKFETLDGGKTWSTLPTPKGIVGDAYFHDTQNGWAVTKSKDEFYVMRTTDGGQTWKTVMTKKISSSSLTNVVIRSAGKQDAWVECIGDSGMTQTSYSLFHTLDGGKSWQVVIANSTAGGGPAPGFSMDVHNLPHNTGSSPGMLYVVNPNTAFMNGQCEACDKANTIGWTNNGGKTWTNGNAQFTGYGPNLLAFSDANHGWWITTEYSKPSVFYTTSDGGKHWTKVHTFK
jgi:photosystem II stability/assembly factor-like uncharacterized protein